MEERATKLKPVEKTANHLDYETPERLLGAVRAYFGGRIPLDPATAADNPTDAEVFLTPEEDGLVHDWDASSVGQGAFVNPPYGREGKLWLEKVHEEAEKGLPILLLISVVRTEQAYFQEVVRNTNARCWVRKRVGFIDPTTKKRAKSNPHASVIYGFNVDVPHFEGVQILFFHAVFEHPRT